MERFGIWFWSTVMDLDSWLVYSYTIVGLLYIYYLEIERDERL